jgi:uncharacterized protein (TIRG00374 family)
MMLRVQGARLPFLYLLKNYYIGYFFSVLLPSNVGGDVVRSYYAGKRVGDQYTSAVAVFIERFSGVLFLLILAIVTPFLQPALVRHWAVMIPMVGAGVLIVCFVLVMMNERLLTLMDAVVHAVFRGAGKVSARFRLAIVNRILDKILKFYEGVFEKGLKFYRKFRKTVPCFRERPVYLMWMVLLSVLFYVMTWFNVLFAFKAFGADARFMDIVSLLPTAMLVSMIPITLGSIGLAEGAYVFYFLLVGIPKESSFIMGLLLRFKLMIVAGMGFLLYLTYSDRKEEYEEMVSSETAEGPSE